MITFNVVKEQYGWSVRTGACMTTPFWSRSLAIREANCLAESIRRHGEIAHVIIDSSGAEEMPRALEVPRSFRPSPFRRDRRGQPR